MNIRKLLRKNIEFKIDSLFDYNVFIESNIDKELSGIQKKYEALQLQYEESKNEKTEINEDEDDYYLNVFDDLSYSHEKIQDDILLKHRNSFVFLVYGLIEDEFYFFAKSKLFEKNIFSIDDLKGNSIFERFKNYTSKTDPELYESIKGELLFFDNLRVVRNIITHKNNLITVESCHYKKIKEFSKGLFELKPITSARHTVITDFRITLNDKKFIDMILEKLNIVFDKMYLRN